MALFVAIAGFGRLRSSARMTCTAVLMWICIRYDRWEVFLFLAGMFIAEVDLITIPSHRRPGAGNCGLLGETAPALSTLAGLVEHAQRGLWIMLFTIGLYLGSSPSSDAENTPGYRYLMALVPSTWSEKHAFWKSIGGILIVWSIKRSVDLQPYFTSRFAQYMGKISFAFYLIHGPVLHSLGYTIMPTIWSWTGKETVCAWSTGLVIGGSVCLAIVIWLADVWTRVVDERCVSFARWVERKACGGS